MTVAPLAKYIHVRDGQILALFPGSPRVQTKNCFSVLQATESWAGPGNEASQIQAAHFLLVLLLCYPVLDCSQYAKVEGEGLEHLS